jgi:hypothetical protein
MPKAYTLPKDNRILKVPSPIVTESVPGGGESLRIAQVTTSFMTYVEEGIEENLLVVPSLGEINPFLYFDSGLITQFFGNTDHTIIKAAGVTLEIENYGAINESVLRQGWPSTATWTTSGYISGTSVNQNRGWAFIPSIDIYIKSLMYKPYYSGATYRVMLWNGLTGDLIAQTNIVTSSGTDWNTVDLADWVTLDAGGLYVISMTSIPYSRTNGYFYYRLSPAMTQFEEVLRNNNVGRNDLTNREAYPNIETTWWGPADIYFSDDRELEFYTEGEFILESPIPNPSTVISSSIKITTDEPLGTNITVSVDISFDGGNIWEGYVMVVDNDSIPHINGQTLTNAVIRIKAEFSTTDISVTPTLQSIELIPVF